MSLIEALKDLLAKLSTDSYINSLFCKNPIFKNNLGSC